jgi:hypothetical protein
MLEAYTGLLRAALGEVVQGVYLYGSVALGAYEADKSDVDFLTVLTRPLTEEELGRLHGVHLWLEREHRTAGLLEGMYIPVSELGQVAPELAPHPYYANKRLTAKGHYDLNAVTLWTVKNRGLTVAGLPAGELTYDTPWEQVRQTMRYNLEHYWPSRAQRRFAFFLDEWIESCVLTLCRIRYTLEHQDLISKTAAGAYGLETCPPRWHPLIQETLRLRNGDPARTQSISRMQRSREAKAFLAYVRESCRPFL